jgi:hypothetical protein
VYAVQTWAGHRAANWLSDKLGTKVEIGRVEIEFFSKVVLSDVYIEDQHQDTLLYSKQLRLDISQFSLKNERIDIKEIQLSDTKARMVKYASDKSFNYRFILEAFANTDTTQKDTTAGWKVNFNDITLNNVEVLYRNEHYNTDKREWINWNDLHIKKINGKISNIIIDKDTLHAKVVNLAAIEKSGFKLEALSCGLRVDPSVTTMDSLLVRTPNSLVSTFLEFQYKEYEDFQDFIERVRMKANLGSSKLYIGDLGYFAPELLYNKNTIMVKGDVTGKVTGLKGKNLHILFGDKTEFKGNASFTGLPDIEQTAITLDVEKLTTNKSDLEKIHIAPFKENKYLEVPSNLGMLGQMSFKGDFDGFINDFYAHGNFSTALGGISSSIGMQKDTDGEMKYHGKIRSSQFDIGKFLAVKDLGRVTIDADVDGKGLSKDNVNAKLKGIVKSIEYNSYNYQNATVEGELAKNVFKGVLNIKDENIDMVFKGGVDFTKKLPTLNFMSTIEYANLKALNFVKDEASSIVSTQIDINGTGNNIDNFIGRINVDNTIYRENNEVYRMSEFDLSASESQGTKTLRLSSDFADGIVTGKFTILEMTNSLVNVLSSYLPSLKKEDTKKLVKKNAKEIPQDFSFNVQFKKSDDLVKLLRQKITIAPGTTLAGNYNSNGKTFLLTGRSSALDLYGTKVKNWKINANTDGGTLSFITSSSLVAFSDSLYMENFSFNASAKTDSMDFSLNWNNTSSKQKYSGDIKGGARFRGLDKLTGSILSSTVVIADTMWTIDGNNRIAVDSSYIAVQNLLFKNASQSVRVDGAISKNKRDQLILGLTNFNLANISLLTRQSGLNISGRVSGNTSVSDVYDKLRFASSLDFKTLRLNSESFAAGTVNSFWDKEKDAVQLNGSFSKGMIDQVTGMPINNFQFDGTYYPGKKEESIDMNVYLMAMPLNFFEQYTKEFCSDLKGQILSGKARVTGTPDNPVLTGKVMVQAKKVRVNYLNTFYSFADTIFIESNSFGVENMKVFDQYGNVAVVRGKVYHNDFKNFQLDFDINAKKFMVLNTTESLNKLYYGKAYATGIINLFGYLDNITIDAAVKTERGTQFNIPLSGPSEVSEENDFITFVKKDTNNTAIADDYQVNLKGLQMNFDLEVTPDAEVQLIFDSKIGDVIKGRGMGNIKMNINTFGNFNMYGDYNITEGDYQFWLQNVISKKFEIEYGSTIKWSGDPYDADVALTAVYKLRSSLNPFFPTDSTGTYKKRYPVDCKLIMSNKLMSPDITFDIDLPTVDESTRTTVKGYINTEAEMNKQVFALLILKSFVTPPQLSSQGANEYAGAGAAGANSSELLSNQLSNWLSQISRDVDVGVNYRPGDELNSEEIELIVSTQILDDRVTIDGNVNVSDKQNQGQSTSNVVGDVNVEYKLTPDGKLRVKAFNKANDNTLVTDNAPYTQGVGLFYREEFNSLGDLYRRYTSKLRKNKEKSKSSPPPVPQP